MTSDVEVDRVPCEEHLSVLGFVLRVGDSHPKGMDSGFHCPLLIYRKWGLDP